MEKLCTLLSLCLFSWSVSAQVFDWGVSIGGADYDESQCIALDKSGNTLLTGRFEGTVDFDPSVNTFNLTSNGKRDVFIQKLDKNGHLIWAKNIGGASRDDAYSITTDTARNVLITGRFEATVDFDPGTSIFNLISNGSRDLYVLKLDSNGSFLWARTIGGTQSDRGASVTTDEQGNVVVSGYYGGTVDFDPGSPTFNMTSFGNEDVFILKLDPSGNFAWVKTIGGSSDDEPLECTSDPSGNLYITGFYEGTVDFDPSSTTFNLSSNGDIDAFILKLDAKGDFVWANSMGGTSSDEAQSIVVDQTGNIYVTGYFEGIVDFDPSANSVNLTSKGMSDAFIRKMNSSWGLIWAKSIGGSGNEEGRSISVDSSGNTYVTGYFEDTVDFDPGSTTFNLISNGQTDGFIQKLDVNGNFVWAIQIGGTSFDNGNSIVTDMHGNVFTTGNFSNIIDVDPSSGTFNLSAVGFTDVYIQKLSQCFPTSGTNTVSACNSYTWIDGNNYTASDSTATHTLSTARGCDSIVTLNLTINKVADISTSTNGLTITAVNQNASYQWLDCNNNYKPLVGKTKKDFIASTNGSYAVELVENTCLDTSECVSIATVGTNESDPFWSFNLYPNPTVGTVNIELGQFSDVSIRVVDMNARLIYNQENIYGPLHQFELVAEPGVYFLTLKAQGATQKYKLIKL